MEPYYILLLTTGILSPFAFVVAGVPWLTAIRFTLIGHVLAAFLGVILILAHAL